MTEAELLVAKFNTQTERVIYTTQEAWDEGVSCVGQVSVRVICSSCTKCVNSHSCVGSCIYTTPIAFS
jgi:hypothetical protein